MAQKTLEKPDPAVDNMRRELRSIFDAISQELGRDQAQHAARTLRSAAQEGRIDGHTFFNDIGEGRPIGCIVGWIGKALGRDAALEPLPGWTPEFPHATPVEEFAFRFAADRDTREETVILVQTIDDWVAAGS